jgi:hypothetical protein
MHDNKVHISVEIIGNAPPKLAEYVQELNESWQDYTVETNASVMHFTYSLLQGMATRLVDSGYVFEKFFGDVKFKRAPFRRHVSCENFGNGEEVTWWVNEPFAKATRNHMLAKSIDNRISIRALSNNPEYVHSAFGNCNFSVFGNQVQIFEGQSDGWAIIIKFKNKSARLNYMSGLPV